MNEKEEEGKRIAVVDLQEVGCGDMDWFDVGGICVMIYHMIYEMIRYEKTLHDMVYDIIWYDI